MVSVNPSINLHRVQIEAVCRRFGVRRLFLFGSGARPAFDPAHSDMDFYVEFGPPPTGSRADQYFGLLFALQDLLGHPVDLVEVGAIQNPIVLASVESTKVPLYAAA